MWILCGLFPCIFWFSSSGDGERIKGDGNIATRTFAVEDFDRVFVGDDIEYSHRMGSLNPFAKNKKRFPVFNYMQTAGSSSLQITTDENLFPYLSVEVKEGRLLIRSTEENLYLRPTRFVVNGASPSLRKVSISGSMDFIAEHPLAISIGDFSVTGKGDLKLLDVRCDTLSCQISGQGNMYVVGKVPVATYEVSGIGHVYAFDCESEEVDCEVSGIGSMELTVNRYLKAETSGIGKIRYRGTAEPHTSVSGIGRVKRVD